MDYKAIATRAAKGLPSAPRSFYGWLLDLANFIVGATSDSAADIAARAMPLVVPIPNAISVYLVSQTHLGFNEWQALAFAVSIEIAMFAVIEVALYIFDGYMEDKERYRLPFRISVAVCVAVLLIVIAFVVVVETSSKDGNPILAMLSLLSAAAAVMLALKRWRKRDIERRTALKLAQDNDDVERLKRQVAELQTMVSAEKEDKLRVQTEANHTRTMLETSAKTLSNLDVELAKRDGLIETLRGQVAFLEGQTERLGKMAVAGVSEPAKPLVSEPKQTRTDPTLRRFGVLVAATKVGSKGELNFAELARTYGVSDTMVRKDLSWLEESGYWLNHDNWEPTEKGKEWLASSNVGK